MGRIARTVGEDHAVRFESEDVVRRGVERNSDDVRVSLGLADNVPLDATIHDDDGPFAQARVTYDLATADLGDEVECVRVRSSPALASDRLEVLGHMRQGRLPHHLSTNLDR